mmetsp:Transcript_46760/g.118355  ORF Transcript_46760/g.118355 Transcript_46760/m.118355 type:complete len:353 (-) Transcript_46760:139-1197(-)
MVLLLPLNVTTTREGWLRLSGYFSVMAILLVTATLSILYETTFLTVVDRDFRDMLWDYRTTQTGIARYHRMLGTAYWPTYLARVDDWEVDLLRPSEDIPTIVIYTGSTAACTRSIGSVSNNLCAQMEEAVDLAVSAHPGRLRVVREPSGSVSPVPQLEVFFLGVQQPEALISPNRVSIEEVDAFVAGVIDTYVDPQYKPPRVGSSYVALYNSVQVAGRNVPLSLMANSTQDKMRFLWPWELWPWPRPCTNTSYAENSLLGAPATPPLPACLDQAGDPNTGRFPPRPRYLGVALGPGVLIGTTCMRAARKVTCKDAVLQAVCAQLSSRRCRFGCMGTPLDIPHSAHPAHRSIS